MNTDEPQGFEGLLGDGAMRPLLEKLGIEDDAPEAQARVLDAIGKTVFKHMMLKVLEILPASARAELDAHMGSGDMMAFRAFLAQHIDDVEGFLQKAAKEATDSILERARQLESEE